MPNLLRDRAMAFVPGPPVFASFRLRLRRRMNEGRKRRSKRRRRGQTEGIFLKTKVLYR